MLRTKLNRLLLSLLMSFVLASAALLTTASAAVTQPLWGDLNLDGETDALDLVEFKLCLLMFKTPNPSAVFDLNGDGQIDALDYAALKKALLIPAQNDDIKVIKANTDFAFDIFKVSNKNNSEKNVFISPLSISTALSMVYQGAGSTTRDEMTKALKYEGLDINTINRGYKTILEYLNSIDPMVKLNISNSIWYKYNLNINNNFLETNKNIFGSYISPIDFTSPDAANTINTWISNATNHLIPSMLQPPLDDMALCLINAIYFKGQWTNIFDEKMSYNGSFYTGNNVRKNVVYMKKIHETMDYGEGTGYKAVRLPYGNGSMAMYCILPDGNVNDLIANLNAEKWNEIKKSIASARDVELLLPRFKMEYAESLNDALKTLGMNKAFDSTADFTGIAPGLFISEVKHKAVVEVNEKGTEAAAVTAVLMPTSVMPVEHPEFIADRPFVFVIADEKKGNIIFLGKAFDLQE